MFESGRRIAARQLDEAEHAPVAEGGQAVADLFGDAQAAPGQVESELLVALHGGDERPRVQRRTEALIGLLALIARREGFGRVRPCRFEPPRTTLEQREVAGHVREACLVAGGARAFVDDPEQRARLVQLVGPDVGTRQRCRRAQVGHRNEAIALLAHGLAERRPPGSGLHAGVELGRRGERPDVQVPILRVVTGQAERLPRRGPRLARAARVNSRPSVCASRQKTRTSLSSPDSATAARPRVTPSSSPVCS